MQTRRVHVDVKKMRNDSACANCHDSCVECIAAGINCNFNDPDNKDLAKLMQIVDAWSIVHPGNEEVDG